ncbi:uncharacterized protein At4g18257-like isoform X1 [Nymphaea colorata]|uniref:uncharacterized protein At4g18257-like isoform X1 n=1 Tax=Nymphaea colorata TaxID=210225 RepID=UPI00129E9C6E|nr:uncharacterized protein At4g18257-like isoform X1 [Nymphaea colorata]XP_031491282.1 uncharacterized protein At4g18257-like isoform X1 [Nymphaea colorata]XP_031491283.1 uncharacterized protein At4g18257-like isoform X1 [Nymphaea colorata]XP_049934905.1 uncharacterized protein At4g18257-like isoform X1 [Nymphaea colorata]
MAEEERRRVSSLGWLTESAVMPKKQKVIEGVGASSILELKAQLYKTQEEARKAKESASDAEFHRAKKRIVPNDVFSRKNSGVESRATRFSTWFEKEECDLVAQLAWHLLRDKLELKAVEDGSASYAALERKAELYEKLSRGDLPDEEESEKYCVDFFSKSLSYDECGRSKVDDASSSEPKDNKDVDSDVDIIPNLFAKPVGPGRTSETVDRDEHKRLVREVHEEASQARETASALKLRRQAQAQANREKLRQAYLRKQIEKLKAAEAEESRQATES